MTHTHLIGIGGTGLSAIAKVLLERGETVSGSDRQHSPLSEKIEEAGAKVSIGHTAENVAGADVVLRSSAVPDENVEVQAAIVKGIPVQKRIDYLGNFLAKHKTIGVAGSHGKTTTSAMISWMLTDLGLAPGFIVGGEVENLGTNASAGKGNLFVIEADEYDYMFWGLKPEIAIVTNVEHDHPDCFPTKEIFFEAFEGFVDRIEDKGVLLACIDDPGADKLMAYAESQGKKTLRYSIRDNQSEYFADNLVPIAGAGYQFDVLKNNKKLASVKLSVPGKHNVQNALAAMIVADLQGLDLNAAGDSLARFEGAGRRFEVLGEVGGVIIIDDYGHHPTEINATLSAAKARYPHHRLWAVWQPHTYSRTLELLEAFGSAFSSADKVMITKVYAARESQPDEFSVERLMKAVDHPQVNYTKDHAEASQYLAEHTEPSDVVIVFSAGDATEISASLYQSLKQGEQNNV